jgi:hypothetical protein
MATKKARASRSQSDTQPYLLARQIAALKRLSDNTETARAAPLQAGDRRIFGAAGKDKARLLCSN